MYPELPFQKNEEFETAIFYNNYKRQFLNNGTVWDPRQEGSPPAVLSCGRRRPTATCIGDTQGGGTKFTDRATRRGHTMAYHSAMWTAFGRLHKEGKPLFLDMVERPLCARCVRMAQLDRRISSDWHRFCDAVYDGLYDPQRAYAVDLRNFLDKDQVDWKRSMT